MAYELHRSEREASACCFPSDRTINALMGRMRLTCSYFRVLVALRCAAEGLAIIDCVVLYLDWYHWLCLCC
jgi:hypothetical protein